MLAWTLKTIQQQGVPLDEECVAALIDQLGDEDAAAIAASTVGQSLEDTEPELSEAGEALGAR